MTEMFSRHNGRSNIILKTRTQDRSRANTTAITVVSDETETRVHVVAIAIEDTKSVAAKKTGTSHPAVDEKRGIIRQMTLVSLHDVNEQTTA